MRPLLSAHIYYQETTFRSRDRSRAPARRAALDTVVGSSVRVIIMPTSSSKARQSRLLGRGTQYHAGGRRNPEIRAEIHHSIFKYLKGLSRYLVHAFPVKRAIFAL